MEKMDKDEFERLKIDDTKVVDPNKINDAINGEIDDETLRNLSREELMYMLEYEDFSPEIVKKIKHYITLKK